MSIFLDQDEIDRLQRELASVSEKKEKSLTAKDKIRKMYAEVVKYSCPNDMNNLDEIGVIINDINMKINTQSKYYESFTNLKYSYSKRN